MIADPTNDDRADWAQQALDTFANSTRMDTAGEETETVIQDLLTNLMHLAKREGLVMEEIISRAKGMFEEEVWAERQYLKPTFCADDGTCSCAKFGADPNGCTRLIPVGRRSICKLCDQDIEWTGDDWRDRGGNRECVRTVRGGEAVVPAEGQTHEPT